MNTKTPSPEKARMEYKTGDDECRLLRRYQPVDFVFDNITYKVPTGRGKKESKTLLKGVSGSFNSSELTGILGPSGAGKTTLTNILAGYRLTNVTGSVKVNGEDRDIRTFRKLSSYIMADEELLPHLTVMESMMISASLKMPARIPAHTKIITVNEILSKLGLSECVDTKAGQLSGGQRKRLSIAQELVNNPPLMFFDEPTSGLDSQSSLQCVQLLKSLAADGRTIVCTIHQPSARLFEVFDRIYVMADGAFIYKGTVPNLLPYLKSQGLECPSYHNPADFVIEIACGEHGDVVERLTSCVCDESIKSDQELGHTVDDSKIPVSNGIGKNAKYAMEMEEYDGRKIDPAVSIDNDVCKVDISMTRQHSVDDGHSFAAGLWTQFIVLFVRSWKCMLRDTYLTHLRLFAHISVGLLIGILYFGVGNDAAKTLNNIGYLFFSLLFLAIAAMMSTIVTFPLEMAVFTREHLNCWYNVKAYYCAKSTADVPFQIIFPLVYSTITYWMTGQPADFERFLLFLLISVLISLTAQALGLLIGAATSLQIAIFLGPAVTIPLVLFSGFFATFDTIPWYLRWMTYASYIRYAYEGALLCVYGNQRPPLECNQGFSLLCVMKDPEFILETLGVKERRLWVDILALIIFFLLFRICCYLMLRWRVRSLK